MFLLMVAVLAAVIFNGLLSAPFWFDEQWRAYQIALPGLHLGFADSYAPLAPTWLLTERLVIQLLPTTELVLRLPELLAGLLLGPAFYLLAKKVMPRGIALVAAVALALNPAIIYFGTQLKAYIVEALVTVVILHLWSQARREPDGFGRFKRYGVIALVASFSVPSPFVVGPLFALDLLDAVIRAPRNVPAVIRRGLAPALAGTALLAYVLIALLPQSLAAGLVNWRPFYILQDASGPLHFVATKLPSYLLGPVLGIPELDTRSIAISQAGLGLSIVIAAAVLALVLTGAWTLRRHPVGRGIVAVALGGLVLQLVGSWFQKWPFGLTRANLFFIPVLYLLAGAGVATLVRRGRPTGRRRWLAGSVLLTLMAAGLTAAVINIQNERLILGQVPIRRWMSGARSAVAAARAQYRPGTHVYVWLDGQLTFGAHGKGWTFYMDDYDWTGTSRPGTRIPLTDTYFSGAWPYPDRQLSAYLARRPKLTRLIVAGTAQMRRVLTKDGFHLVWQRRYPLTCWLTVWERSLGNRSPSDGRQA